MDLKKINIEKIIRNCLIVLTLISLIIVALNLTYLVYQNNYNTIYSINDFLIKYINGPLIWIDNILVYIFAGMYIVFAIKSKKEVLLKISFSIFSILTTMTVLVSIINVIAEIFGIF